MTNINADINQSRAMRISQRRIEAFAQQFGEAHLNLARHAAFPLVLTPDLLYQTWVNFVPEAPWTAVAHLLLSRLCRQVGYEMYEMDMADRNSLLQELKEQSGQERFDKLGEFLLDYIAQRLTDDDADTRDLREAQEWTALAYTKPDKAAQELTEKLNKMLQKEDIGEVLRLASLVDTLGEPLVEAGFEPLFTYAKRIIRDYKGIATIPFSELHSQMPKLQKEILSLKEIKDILLNTGSLYCLHYTDWESFINCFNGDLSSLKEAAGEIIDKYDGNISVFLEYKFRHG